MDLLGSTMLSAPFWLSIAGVVSVLGTLALSWRAASRAQMQEADYKEKKQRLPAAAADEVVVERLRLHREELKEIEAKIAQKVNRFGEAERAEAQAGHWQEMVRKLKSDYDGLARERRDVEEVREAYVKASADLAETRTALGDNHARIERLRKEEEELADKLKELSSKVVETADIEDRLRVLKAELDQLRAELAAGKDEREDMMLARARLEDMRGQIEQMQRRSDELAPLVDRLSARIGELKAEITELETLSKQRDDIIVEIERLRIRRSELGESAERVEHRIEGMQREITGLDEQIDERKEVLENIRHELAGAEEDRQEHRRLMSSIEGLSVTEKAIVAHRDELDAEVDRARMRLTDLGSEIDVLTRRIGEDRATLEEIRGEAASLDRQRDEHRRLAVAVEELSARHRALEARIAEREKELPGTGTRKDDVDASLADLIRRPSCLFQDDKPILAIPNREKGENAMLEKVYDHLDKLGLAFDRRLLRRFHVSLKTGRISPLTVLAGISGTGKSQLPQRYAEAMGINFLKVPVQPRWDSPQDLFGFYNYLERTYKATEFARALVHLERHGQSLVKPEFQMQDRVLLVLLDEMNLARVEYYFSEFLSRLEGRPDPNIDDDAVLRPSRIEIEVGADHGRHQSVYPGHNVIYVGTMNQDESTQALSDKVLDRANTIRFPRPGRLEVGKIGEANVPTEQYLPFDTWASWYRPIGDLPAKELEFAKDFVDRLNVSLERIKRPFGHRVNQAILSYVVNHPNYQTNQGVKDALVDMMEMRILPKLRGVELNDTALSAFSGIAAMVENDLGEKDVAAEIRNGAQRSDIFDWTGMPQK